jgi:hypothetical protein
MHQKIGFILQRLDTYRILLGGVVGRPEAAWIRRETPDIGPVVPDDFSRSGLILFCR